jgi:hypothetical protein
VIFILVVFTATTLPFVLIKDDRVRKRIYMPFSAVPASVMLLTYLREYNAYSILMIGVMFILPLSLLLTAIGIVLVVRACSRKEAWVGLALGALLASAPILLLIGVILWSNNHFRPWA